MALKLIRLVSGSNLNNVEPWKKVNKKISYLFIVWERRKKNSSNYVTIVIQKYVLQGVQDGLGDILKSYYDFVLGVRGWKIVYILIFGITNFFTFSKEPSNDLAENSKNNPNHRGGLFEIFFIPNIKCSTHFYHHKNACHQK